MAPQKRGVKQTDANVEKAARLLAERVAFLRPFDAATVRQLVQSGQLWDLDPGAVLRAHGDTTRTLDVVVEGRLDVVRVVGGRPHPFRFLPPGEVVSISTLGGCPHSATLMGGDPMRTRVLELGPEAVKELVRREPQVALDLMAVLGGRINALTNEMQSLLLEIEQRIAHRLLHYAEHPVNPLFDLDITQERLAFLVGASRAKVNHALKALVQAGAIEVEPQLIRVVDRNKLRAILSNGAPSR